MFKAGYNVYLHLVPLGAPVNVQFVRKSDSSLKITWEDPDNMHLFPEVTGFEVGNSYF